MTGWQRSYAMAIASIAVVVGALVIAVLVRPAQPVSARAELVGQTTSAPSVRQSVLFFGDDYTIGPGFETDSGYACLAAAALKMDCNLSAQPATGFISGGDGQRLPSVVGGTEPDSTSIIERIPEAQSKFRADVIVFDGGRNDVRFGQTYFSNVFTYTLEQAKQVWPKAKFVVIAPFFVTRMAVQVPHGDGTYGDLIRSILASTPDLNDVALIDPARLGWLSGIKRSSLLADDRIDPNANGHQLLGKRLAPALANAIAGQEPIAGQEK
ncbi:SGNH/GDSL hydrolase family protein [Gordonia sp. 852002-51296_SCH5728562-b]|uniref:SGNH/GDSL hydrolase family protein n=1 Tax=Gordonia sp. 852002-51296_SCH5728562-b TaxID=1834101 RepID=UPI0007E96579|nr:SGNH/GDSL hydrolase family protein [Gordonia sp. 852002-51296_SCH5728562-b]OBA33736.1 hypothetical protein A5766_11585 [Gordonia sp. 852002-51296_SCH5728562-b]